MLRHHFFWWRKTGNFSYCYLGGIRERRRAPVYISGQPIYRASVTSAKWGSCVPGQTILEHDGHPSSSRCTLLSAGKRYRSIRCRNARLQRSFFIVCFVSLGLRTDTSWRKATKYIYSMLLEYFLLTLFCRIQLNTIWHSTIIMYDDRLKCIESCGWHWQATQPM